MPHSPSPPFRPQAKDSEGQVSTLPSGNSSDPKAETLYYGAMVPDAAQLEKALGNSSLPVLHFFTEHEGDTETVKGGWSRDESWLGCELMCNMQSCCFIYLGPGWLCQPMPTKHWAASHR
jgi:hypothetical protein